MGIDTSPYQNLGRGVKSVADYDNEYAQQRQNKLAELMGGMKMDEYKRGIESQNALRQAVSGFGKDQTENYNALLRTGQLDEAQKYQKSNLDMDESRGKVNKQNVDLIDAKLKQSRGFLETVTTPEQYIAWHEGNHKDPVLGPALAARGVTAEQARASIMQAIQTPGGLQELLKKSALGIEKFTELNKPTFQTRNTGGTTDTLQLPGLGGAPAVVNSIKNTQSPDSIASNAIQIRGQNMTDARGRAGQAQSASQHAATLAQGGKPPAGYRFKADGELEPIPGGPAGKAAVATEGERKAATLLKRLEGSEAQLSAALGENPDAAKPGVIATGLRSVGSEMLANGVTGQARQRVEAAQLDILDAALTLGTGAAYTKEQIEGYRKSYFPQINDSAKTVADKKARLKNVIDAAKIAAGRAGPGAPAVNPIDSLLDKYK